MKIFLVLLMIGSLGLFTGCHSGTTRGMGSDISKLGNSMQK